MSCIHRRQPGIRTGAVGAWSQPGCHLRAQQRMQQPHRFGSSWDVGPVIRRCPCRIARAQRAAMTRAASKSAVVVGGGVGGLVCAARLAQAGMRVQLLEKNAQLGGRMCSFSLEGFRFDKGPSLLLYPDLYAETFAELGRDIHDCIRVAKVQERCYRVHFGDGTALDMLYDVQAMVSQLNHVEPGAGDRYLQWLSRARAALSLSKGVVTRDPEDLPSVLTGAAPLLTQASLPEILGPHHAGLGAYFQDSRLRAMFTFQDLYVGLSPYNAPGVYSLLAATELTDGVWYPMGGFGTVADALVNICADEGVEVRVSAEVEEITVNGGRATGVRLQGGETLLSDVVVCNRDLPAAYGLIKGAGPYPEERASALDKLNYSASVVAFDWGVEGELPMLAHHNVFLCDEYRRSWERAVRPGDLAARPNFYLHHPCRTDRSAAPSGKSSIMVLLPVAEIGPGGAGAEKDWGALVDAGRETVLSFLDAHGVPIRGNIVCERVVTPPDWRDAYGLHRGAVFGLSHGLSQLSVLRPRQQDDRIPGLYFCGASTHPGNGVPLAMVSGRLCAARAVRDLGLGATTPS